MLIEAKLKGKFTYRYKWTAYLMIAPAFVMLCSYLWPTLTIIKNTEIKQVMQVIMVLATNQTGMKTGTVIAATVMSLAIPTILFAVFQKYIIGGIAISGIK